MSYIGQQLPADVFSGYVTDTFTGDGSATTFTLSKAPFSEDGLIVVVDNVIQQPTTNFTVSGTTLTIVGTAILSGIKGYAIHTSGAVPSTLASKVDVNGLSDGVILDADGDSTISADTDDQIDFKLGGTDFMSLTATGATITTADNSDTLTLKSTDADAFSGPNLVLYRNSGSPADSDQLGFIRFDGRNDNSQDVTYYKILANGTDVSDGSEDGNVQHQVMTNGTLQNYLSMNSSTGEIVINDGSQDIDFRVETNAYTESLLVNGNANQVNMNKNITNSDTAVQNEDGALRVMNDTSSQFAACIRHEGNHADRYGLKIATGTDDASGTNYAIVIRDGDNTSQGYITFTSGTVTYGAFTAHHPCIIPDADNDSSSSDNAYPYGTLLETTSISYTQKNGADTERGIVYNVQKTSSAYSRKVLGAYGSCMNGGPNNQTNEHQALILGDGHILCNNEKGNISVGDGICSSSTAGIGMKADKTAMIIGIAQEDVTFSGSETKLVAVQYGVRQFTPWTD
jgi:hypothetical protein